MVEVPYKYSFHSQVKNNLSLTVYNSGFEQCEKGFSWGPALRDHFLIHYITSGKGIYKVGEEEYHLGEGDMFLINENTSVYYRADDDEPWKYNWVGFNGTDAKRILNMTPFVNGRVVVNLQNKEFGDLLYEIYRVRGFDEACELEMLGRLYIFLGELVKLTRIDNISFKGNYRYIKSALNYIKFNYSRKIDVKDIANEIGVSRSHLYRVFVSQLGMSPSDYLEKYRVNEALALLKNPDLSIAEVANSVGFDDPLYFSRVFKKNKGVSPSKYR